MKIPVNFFTERWQYNKAGGQTSNPLFAGNFEHKGHNDCCYIYLLDDFDVRYTADIKLKEGEKIYRCDTDMCKLHGIQYLVKINVENGLVYFIADLDIEEPIFETKGVQLRWLNLKQF